MCGYGFALVSYRGHWLDSIAAAVAFRWGRNARRLAHLRFSLMLKNVRWSRLIRSSILYGVPHNCIIVCMRKTLINNFSFYLIRRLLLLAFSQQQIAMWRNTFRVVAGVIYIPGRLAARTLRDASGRIHEADFLGPCA